MKKIIIACFTVATIYLALLLCLPVWSANASVIGFKSSKKTLYIGKTSMLEFRGAIGEITWDSKDKSIATVNEDGKVTPINEGETIISATYKNTEYLCLVTVKKPFINKNKITLYPLEGTYLKLTGTKIKKWSFTDDSVVTAVKNNDNNLGISPCSPGKTVISIVGKDKQTYDCEIEVIDCDYTVSYYDKNQTKLKDIKYYVDGRVVKYTSCDKRGSKYYFIYSYDKDTYTEYQYNASYCLGTKTVYDYSDNVISEIEYKLRSTEDSEENWSVVKYYDNEGYHVDTYDGRVKLPRPLRYNRDHSYVTKKTYDSDNNLIKDFTIDRTSGVNVVEYYYNANPYFMNKSVTIDENGVKEEKHFDFSGKVIRILTYSVDGFLLSDTAY